MEVPTTGATIVLVVEGAAEMSSESGEVRLSPGGAAWVPASESGRVLRSVGGAAAEAFVASVPA